MNRVDYVKDVSNRIKEAIEDYKVILGIKEELCGGDLISTMNNLQTYTQLKANYLKSLNNLHSEALQVMSKIQYSRFQDIQKEIKNNL